MAFVSVFHIAAVDVSNIRFSYQIVLLRFGKSDVLDADCKCNDLSVVCQRIQKYTRSMGYKVYSPDWVQSLLTRWGTKSTLQY